MHYRLADFGVVFSTRERGVEMRRRIEDILRGSGQQRVIVLDFAGVELISFSFADEVVGRLLLETTAMKLGEHIILIENSNEEVQDTIERSLERRNLLGVCRSNGELHLLGAPSYLEETFAAARRRREFSTTELALDLAIGVPACNNRLRRLLDAGLLTRTQGIPKSGGRQFVYRVPAALI